MQLTNLKGQKFTTFAEMAAAVKAELANPTPREPVVVNHMREIPLRRWEPNQPGRFFRPDTKPVPVVEIVVPAKLPKKVARMNAAKTSGPYKYAVLQGVGYSRRKTKVVTKSLREVGKVGGLPVLEEVGKPTVTGSRVRQPMFTIMLCDDTHGLVLGKPSAVAYTTRKAAERAAKKLGTVDPDLWIGKDYTSGLIAPELKRTQAKIARRIEIYGDYMRASVLMRGWVDDDRLKVARFFGGPQFLPDLARTGQVKELSVTYIFTFDGE